MSRVRHMLAVRRRQTDEGALLQGVHHVAEEDQDVVKGNGSGRRQKGRGRASRRREEGLWLPGQKRGWVRQHYCKGIFV